MANKRNIAGPLMGAAIIGVGIGYFIFQSTGNVVYGALAVVAITIGDFAFIMLANKYFHKDK